MIKVVKVPKLIIKIIKTLLENCKNNQKISLKNLDFMPNLRLVYKIFIFSKQMGLLAIPARGILKPVVETQPKTPECRVKF